MSIIIYLLLFVIYSNGGGVVKADKIIFYSSPTTSTGNFGSRVSSQTYCSGLAQKPPTCSPTVSQVASWNSGEEIRDFPSLYTFSPTLPVEGPTGIQIASSWSNLMAGTLTNSLYTAGALPTGSWWSGSTTTGAVDSYTCLSWTALSLTISGRYGSSISTSTPWISNLIASNCFKSYYRLCMCVTQTSTPTLNPTRNPTKNPTNNPTQNPTQNPTRDPTILKKGQLRRWKLPQGGQIKSPQGPGNSTQTPLEMSISGQLIPILWTNFNWTLMTIPQETIPICNPIPTTLPGGVEYDLLGYRICPTVEICSSSLGPPFTSLRACVVNYTEIEDGSLTTISKTKALLIDGELDGSTPPLPQQQILCNSAIDREINCQLKRQNPSYILQCQDEPITCYQNDTIGHFFGLLEDQNPNFRYPINQSLWTDELYLGVASILNNLTYFKNDVKEDPFTQQEILQSYYWTGEQSEVITQETQYLEAIWVADVLQLQPYNLFQQIKEEDYTSTPPSTNCLTGSFPQPECLYQTFENQTFARGPGVWITPNITTGTTLLWFNITFLQEAQGAELYLNNTLIWQNKTKALSYTLPSTGQPGDIKIRILGWVPKWDIPSSQLGPSVPFIPDSLWSSLTLGVFQFPYYPSLAGNYLVRGGNIGTTEGDFPFLPTTETIYNLTVEAHLSIQQSQVTWQPIADLILNQNIYPENLALREIESLYTTRATNLTLDKDYLYQIWANRFARRHSSEDVDCKTFDLGEVVNRKKGNSGGCICDPFYDTSFFCSRCLPGLGGENCSLPFQSLYPGQPPQYALGVPIDFPDLSLSLVMIYIDEQWKAPLCQSLTYLGENYQLLHYQGVSITYSTTSSWIIFIGNGDDTGEIYINGTIVAFTQIQEPPLTPVYQISSSDPTLGEHIFCNSILGSQYYLILNTTTISINGWWWIL